MAITSKERELAAVGISIAASCRPCTDFHVKMAREVGAANTEIQQAMTDAVSVRRDATEIMVAYGLAHLGENKPKRRSGYVGATDRTRELGFIGAAFAVNCVSTMKSHLEAAEEVGIPPEDITAIVKLSAFIKGKAASHVEHLAETIEKPEVAYGQAVSACC